MMVVIKIIVQRGIRHPLAYPAPFPPTSKAHIALMCVISKIISGAQPSPAQNPQERVKFHSSGHEMGVLVRFFGKPGFTVPIFLKFEGPHCSQARTWYAKQWRVAVPSSNPW